MQTFIFEKANPPNRYYNLFNNLLFRRKINLYLFKITPVYLKNFIVHKIVYNDRKIITV